MKILLLPVLASIVAGALIGAVTSLVMDDKLTEYQQIVEDCEVTGDRMQTEPRLVIREIDRNQVEVKINAKVCKTPNKEALK